MLPLPPALKLTDSIVIACPIKTTTKEKEIAVGNAGRPSRILPFGIIDRNRIWYKIHHTKNQSVDGNMTIPIPLTLAGITKTSDQPEPPSPAAFSYDAHQLATTHFKINVRESPKTPEPTKSSLFQFTTFGRQRLDHLWRRSENFKRIFATPTVPTIFFFFSSTRTNWQPRTSRSTSENPQKPQNQPRAHSSNSLRSDGKGLITFGAVQRILRGFLPSCSCLCSLRSHHVFDLSFSLPSA